MTSGSSARKKLLIFPIYSTVVGACHEPIANLRALLVARLAQVGPSVGDRSAVHSSVVDWWPADRLEVDPWVVDWSVADWWAVDPWVADRSVVDWSAVDW